MGLRIAGAAGGEQLDYVVLPTKMNKIAYYRVLLPTYRIATRMQFQGSEGSTYLRRTDGAAVLPVPTPARRPQEPSSLRPSSSLPWGCGSRVSSKAAGLAGEVAACKRLMWCPGGRRGRGKCRESSGFEWCRVARE